MVVTIKEARMRIEELEKEYDEFLKLQNYCMCMDLTKPGESTYADSPEKDKRREMLKNIREEVDIISDLRTVFTNACLLCKLEIERLNDVIDNQKVNI